MKTGDKVATVIFWTIAGGAGLLIGLTLIYSAIVDMRNSRLEFPVWIPIGIGTLFVGLSCAGIWEAIRSFNRVPPKNE